MGDIGQEPCLGLGRHIGLFQCIAQFLFTAFSLGQCLQHAFLPHTGYNCHSDAEKDKRDHGQQGYRYEYHMIFKKSGQVGRCVGLFCDHTLINNIINLRCIHVQHCFFQYSEQVRVSRCRGSQIHGSQFQIRRRYGEIGITVLHKEVVGSKAVQYSFRCIALGNVLQTLCR